MLTSTIRHVRTGLCCLSRRSISQSLRDRWVVYGGVEDGGGVGGYGAEVVYVRPFHGLLCFTLWAYALS